MEAAFEALTAIGDLEVDIVDGRTLCSHIGSVSIVRFTANKGDQGSISISANTLASTAGATTSEVFMAVREGGTSSTILTNYKSTTGAYGTNGRLQRGETEGGARLGTHHSSLLALDVDEVQYIDCICQNTCSGSFTLSFRGDGPSAVGSNLIGDILGRLN